MAMLSDEDLRLIKKSQEAALPDRVTIKRNVRVDDGFGGTEVDSEQTIVTDLPCRMFPGQMEEVLGQQARQVERNVFTFRFQSDAPVKDKDKIVMDDGLEYKVERLKHPRSWGQLLTVEAERLTA